MKSAGSRRLVLRSAGAFTLVFSNGCPIAELFEGVLPTP